MQIDRAVAQIQPSSQIDIYLQNNTQHKHLNFFPKTTVPPHT